MDRCIIVSYLGEKAFSGEQLAALNGREEITLVELDRTLGNEEFVNIADGYEIVAVSRKVIKDLSRETLQKLTKLKALAIYATGYEWIDTDYLSEKGVKLSYLPDYSAVSVAEHTVALLFAAIKKIHMGYDFTRNSRDADISLKGFELRGKKVGIIGFGRIGRKVFSMLSSFEAKVRFYDHNAANQEKFKENYETLDALLSSSDIIVMCASKKRGQPPIIGPDEVSGMKNGILLVNAAREDLIDNTAVAEGIKSGKIFTYAVDEKLPALYDDSLPYGSVLETPHTAWYTREAVTEGTFQWFENIMALCRGEERNTVDLKYKK